MLKNSLAPREREIYIWNIIGSMANALFSVVILMLVTRSLNEEHSDVFSIAWSISQLLIIIGTFQIRTYQATDISGKYKFKQYLMFRIFTIILMMVSSFGYVWMKGYGQYKSIIVLIMSLVRSIEAISDVYEGWFQQKERLDLAGKAVTYRVCLSIIAFGSTILLTKNLLSACLTLLVSYTSAFVFFDVRYGRNVDGVVYSSVLRAEYSWFFKIILDGMPIFINAFLAMSITNAPKMAIDSAIETGILGEGLQAIFNILFMPASFINLAYIVFRPMITKMAVAWNCGRRKELLAILVKIELCLLGTGGIIFVGSTSLGIPILSLIYRVDLFEYKKSLLFIIAGGCFYTFASVFDNALVAMRRQYGLIVSYAITWMYVQNVSNVMVQRWGVHGASLAYASAMVVFFMVTMLIFVVCYTKSRKARIPDR